MGKQSSDQLLRELARAMATFDLTNNYDKHGEETIKSARELSDAVEQFLVLIVGNAKLNKWFNKDEAKFFKERSEWISYAYAQMMGDK